MIESLESILGRRRLKPGEHYFGFNGKEGYPGRQRFTVMVTSGGSLTIIPRKRIVSHVEIYRKKL